MKYGVIDIGSNSVRLMISENGNTLYKKLETTKLALGMKDGVLHDEAVERTVRAVSFFVKEAIDCGVDKVFAFATAAVRNAVNQKSFLDAVYNVCKIVVDVVDGVIESKIGAISALCGNDGGIIDVGGASTEIAVVSKGNLIYSKSVNVGSVRLTDIVNQDYVKANEYASSIINEFDKVSARRFYAIGGTATTIAAILQRLKVYEPEKVDGYVVTIKQLAELTSRLYSLSVEERKNLTGLQPGRADVIANGCAILLSVMRRLEIDCIVVSEKDNLEGYLIYQTENL